MYFILTLFLFLCYVFNYFEFHFYIKSIYFFLYTLRIYFSPDGSLKVYLRYIRHKIEFVID